MDPDSDLCEGIELEDVYAGGIRAYVSVDGRDFAIEAENWDPLFFDCTQAGKLYEFLGKYLEAVHGPG